MTPLERAIAAVNNTARVQDISGDQMGVLGAVPLYVVTNPEEVARAALAAIREPSKAMIEAAYKGCAEYETPSAEDAWARMIGAIDARSVDRIEVSKP